MPELNLDPEEIKELVKRKIQQEVKVNQQEKEEEPKKEAEVSFGIVQKPIIEPITSPEEPSPPTPPERPSPSSKPPEEPGGDGGKVIATLGDYLRGKVRVPGFKQFTTVSISPAILLYHGIAVALGLIDKDADLSAFVEQCVVDWMRWHGVELVVKVYPGMDMFLALEQKFGKSIDKFVSELVKR